MLRPARRVVHACGDWAIMRRQDVGSAHSRIVTVAECRGNVSEPIRIGISIVVDIGDDFAPRRPPSDVSSMAQTVVWGMNEGGVILSRNRRRIIRGAVVDNDYLECGIADFADSLQTFPNGVASVEAADNHRNQRPM